MGSSSDERRHHAWHRDRAVRPLRRGKVNDCCVFAGRHDTGCRSRPAAAESVLSDLDPAAWRRQISWVPQSPTLVPGTILDNMGDLPLDDLSDAAAATGFDEVLASTPDGWNTVIGSGGVGLSVGQRQRLALTRALAAHSQVVILDEPTAHLDAVSEETVVRAIDAMRDAGRTVIVIAHRAAMMEAADAVIDVRSAADEEARA